MKIDKNKDFARSEPPKADQGTLPWDYAGIKPATTPADNMLSKGENKTSKHETSKAAPSMTRGSGYYK